MLRFKNQKYTLHKELFVPSQLGSNHGLHSPSLFYYFSNHVLSLRGTVALYRQRWVSDCIFVRIRYPFLSMRAFTAAKLKLFVYRTIRKRRCFISWCVWSGIDLPGDVQNSWNFFSWLLQYFLSSPPFFLMPPRFLFLHIFLPFQ